MSLLRRRLWCATRYSLRGLGACLRHEEAFRVEVALAALLLPLAFLLGRSGAERALLGGVVLLVLVVELINSALEAVVDRQGGEPSELAARAKDQGSAAVFLSMLAVLLVWAAVLLD
ncbi:MAG: diacylglycerol kinase [Porticoccaceae bacterium]|nr:MAG: diacylglycerol kinase [Porticoccaceae bacterium]